MVDFIHKIGSMAFHIIKTSLHTIYNALFIYLIILLENIVYYYILYDFLMIM